jgi:hypothetical protein
VRLSAPAGALVRQTMLLRASLCECVVARVLQQRDNEPTGWCRTFRSAWLVSVTPDAVFSVGGADPKGPKNRHECLVRAEGWWLW